MVFKVIHGKIYEGQMWEVIADLNAHAQVANDRIFF
jgi:hypothetical protein